MVMGTYMIALMHFGSEAMVYKSCGLRTGAASTFFVAVGSLIWMGMQWGWYVQ